MSSPPVIVIGAGGHAKVVIDLLHRLGRNVVLAVAAAGQDHGASLLGVEIAAGDAAVFAHEPEAVELAMGIGMGGGDPVSRLKARRAMAENFERRGYRFPPLVHPSAVIGQECDIGPGAQLMAGAVVQPGCSIASFVIVNTRASVDHDCVLAEGCHIAPGAVLGGGVSVGADALVGIGASVKQGVAIGAQAVAAGGAMVTIDIENDGHHAGVPARAMR